MKAFLAFVAAVLVACSAGAANQYVREGASGAGTGADWTDAYTALPATLTRGDTYYIADGNYPGYLFDDAVSGTSVITIKKATVADHGTSTGWSDTYGDGEAFFTNDLDAGFSTIQYYASFAIKTSFITIDGAVGGYDGTAGLSSWTNGFGFRSQSTNQGAVFIMLSDKFGTWGARPNLGHITLKHIKLTGTNWPGWTIGLQANAASTTVTNVTIQYCFMEGMGGSIMDIRANPTDWLMERNYWHANNTTNTAHGVGIRMDSVKGPMVFRYNLMSDIVGTGWIGHYTSTASTDGDGIEFYGNVFFRREANTMTGLGIIFSDSVAGTPVVDNWKIYNNTTYNLLTHHRLVEIDTAGSTNIQVYNNLDWNSAGDFTFTNVDDEQNNEDAASDPFIDSANFDFRLASDTATTWVTLSTPYDTDMRGTNRNSSVGAFQYGAGGEGYTPTIVTNNASGARVSGFMNLAMAVP